MPLDHEGLLSAINSGIDSAGGEPPAVADTPDDADLDTGSSVDSAAEVDTSGADKAGGNVDGADDTAPAAAGADSNDKPGATATAGAASGGKSAPGAPKAESAAKAAGPAALTAEAKAAADAAAAAAAKKPADPINDPIDERLKPATKERITALVGTAKQLTTERDQYKNQFEELTGYIADTGANPEQYAQALDYLRMVNSGKLEDRQACLAFMQGEIKALAISLGQPVAGVDLLSDHADLKQKVSDGELSHADAEEIAAGRAQRGQAQQIGERNKRKQDADAETNRALKSGADALSALEVELHTANPTVYAQKKAILVETLKPVFANINPAQWASTFRAAYNALKIAPPAALPGVPRVPVNQPLRAGNPAGGTRPAATSLAEAINQGIESATRR